MITHPVTDRDLARFCAKIAAKTDRYFAEHYPSLDPPLVAYDPKGRKYVRIVRMDMNTCTSRSVVCFVERSTGLIWKAASWKAPAKNFHRGSIYMANRWADGDEIYYNG